MSYFAKITEYFSPEKQPNLEPVSDEPASDQQTPAVSKNKRPLEITPPPVENKVFCSDSADSDAFEDLDSDSDTETGNIIKMGESQEIMEKMTALFNSLSGKIDNTNSKIDTTNDSLREIKDDIKEGINDRARISGMVVELRNEVEFLKAKPLPPNLVNMRAELKQELKAELMLELRDELKPELKAEFREEFGTMYESQFINGLLDEINRHDPGMVIFGYGWPNGITADQFRQFCHDKLKYGDRAGTLTLRSVSVLSRGRGPNPKITVLVMFGSTAERNECLRQSYNLAGSSISLDKFMPKRFEAQYKVFKDKSWKLRNTMDVNTFIGFEEHELVLKQKQKDLDGKRFNWVIFDKWSPKVSDPSPSVRKAGNKSDTNSSNAIAVDAMKQMVFISGIKGQINNNEIEDKLMSDFIGIEDKLLIEKVAVAKKGTLVLHLVKDTDPACFVKKYSGNEFLGEKMRLSQG